jgi:hypothetical protein
MLQYPAAYRYVMTIGTIFEQASNKLRAYVRYGEEDSEEDDEDDSVMMTKGTGM